MDAKLLSARKEIESMNRSTLDGGKLEKALIHLLKAIGDLQDRMTKVQDLAEEANRIARIR